MSTGRPLPVLAVEDLEVCYATAGGPLRALRRVSLEVGASEIVGIVGESGCGKSTLISTIIRLLASNAEITSGSVRLHGEELRTADQRRLGELRGSALSMVFQDPMTTLNPVLTIGRQLKDIQYRLPLTSGDKRDRARRWLERVGIPDAAACLGSYPHELSGGMRQRVGIAMALMMKPDLLIADEPTTALDATLEVQIIHQLEALQAEVGCAILFISHHLGVIAELCDRVVVMYAGEVVESGTVGEIFHAPAHPYTRMLLACDPAAIPEQTRNLPVIPGALPDLINLPGGCIYRDRCDRAAARCERERPEERDLGDGRRVACHFAGEER